MTIESIISTAGKAIIVKMAEDIWHHAKNTLKKEYDKTKLENDLYKFYISLENLRKVKTLW